jgi:hypothetical protein
MLASNCTLYILFLSQRMVYHLADSSRTRSKICTRSSNCLHCRIYSSSSLYSCRREKKSHRLWGRRNSRCKIPFPPASCYKPKLVVASKIDHIRVTVHICVHRMDKRLKGLMRKHSRCGRVTAYVGCGEVWMYAHGSINERTRAPLKLQYMNSFLLPLESLISRSVWE